MGSEMCIRDRPKTPKAAVLKVPKPEPPAGREGQAKGPGLKKLNKAVADAPASKNRCEKATLRSASLRSIIEACGAWKWATAETSLGALVTATEHLTRRATPLASQLLVSGVKALRAACVGEPLHSEPRRCHAAGSSGGRTRKTVCTFGEHAHVRRRASTPRD